MKPSISIVIPILNAKEHLPELLDSLKYISGFAEIIFIDGFSTDGSLDILKLRQPVQSIILSKPPKGIYDAYNAGIAVASGRYVMFLGADDTIHKDIEMLRPMLINPKNRHAMIVCQSIILPDNRVTNHREKDFNLFSINFCHQSIIYNTAEIKKYFFDTRFRVMADWKLNLKIYGSNRESVVFRDVIISKYKLNGFSGRNTDVRWERYHILLKIFNLGVGRSLKYLFMIKLHRLIKNIK